MRGHTKDKISIRRTIKEKLKDIPSKRNGYNERIFASVSQVALLSPSPLFTLTSRTSLFLNFIVSDPRMQVGARQIVASRSTSTSLSKIGSTTSAVSCRHFLKCDTWNTSCSYATELSLEYKLKLDLEQSSCYSRV